MMSALPRFVVLYAAMYAAYGVASPFLPAFVNSRGIAPEELGLVLGTGTAVRLVSAPLAGRIGDLFEALRTVLVLCIALATFTTLGFLPARGFWWFLAISALQAAALAPMTVLADALALGAAKREGFEYGWVRGTGSAAYIIGTHAAGRARARRARRRDALDRDGDEHAGARARAGAAAARHHLRAPAPRLHAPHRQRGAGGARRHRAGDLRHGGNRRRDGARDVRLGLAVRPARRGGLLGDGGALHTRAAAHLAPRALLRAALRTPAPLLHRVQARSPAMAMHALPLELHLAVGVALGQALPPS